MSTPFWQTYPLAPAPCLPCCAPTPPVEGDCCHLLLPSAYAGAGYYPLLFPDAATCRAALDDQVIDCVAYFGPSGLGSPVRTVDLSVVNAVTCNYSNSGSSIGGGANFTMVIALKAGTTNFNWSFSWTGTSVLNPSCAVRAYVFPITFPPGTATGVFCSTDETQFDSNEETEGQSVTGSGSITVSVDGSYTVTFTASPQAEDFDDVTSATASFEVSNSVGLVVTPVIGWFENGTPGEHTAMEACPKFTLPTVTEPLGAWYADCASAAAAITDNTSSCLAYYKPDVGTWNSQSATGGSSLSMAGTLAGTSPNEGGTAEIYGGIFGYEGDTLDLDYAATNDDSTGMRVTVTVYDAETFDVLFTDHEDGGNSVSGTFNYALPYTGRFVVRVVSAPVDEDSESTSVSLHVSSSGIMSALEIQALYDTGLDCPARLDCGDSCP